MNGIALIKHFTGICLSRKLCSLELRTYHNVYTIASRQFSSGNLPTLTMYTKDQCSLCDDARVILEEYKHRYNFEEVYITDKGNEEWYIKYKYEIPVFHLNGTFLMKHRVDEKLLEEKFSEYEKT